MLGLLVEALQKAAVRVPEETASAREQVNLLGLPGERLRQERARVEAAVSSALDLLEANRDTVPDAAGLERTVLESIQAMVFRDLSLFRPHRFERISRENPDS